jgi:hypothetical protein
LFTLVYLLVDDWVKQHPRHTVDEKQPLAIAKS